MKDNIENKNVIKRSDLHNFIGTNIYIVTHTEERIEGFAVAWYKIPKKVKLIMINDSEYKIKIEFGKAIYELDLFKIDEITNCN